MAKSHFLLLCCILFACSVRAQNSRLVADIPLKLEFKKANFGWAAHPNYFPKRSIDPADDAGRSMLFTGPRKNSSVNMRLPEVKHKKVDFQFKAGPREPLFRRQ